MEKHQAYKLMATKASARKMQRILDQLLNEIDDKHRATRKDVVTLTRESQQRLMHYKELYLHRESLGEGELQIVYQNMTITEQCLANMGVLALTHVIKALDKEC
ncbi:hypothetical protein [Vibrio sp. ES.051]|uniref:hypothetical protein n=1 Tax=Vibrio sp. ES.051 TaxID=1761909 RepID=UPI000BFA773C|nr:hypothetical protein [Vibrio sp. ES.051]